MDQKEIQTKAADLKRLLEKHYRELSKYEKEIFKVISEYQKALDEEKLKEIRQSLSTNE